MSFELPGIASEIGFLHVRRFSAIANLSPKALYCRSLNRIGHLEHPGVAQHIGECLVALETCGGGQQSEGGMSVGKAEARPHYQRRQELTAQKEGSCEAPKRLG